MKLMEQLDGVEVVLLDGAMGTELERRGVPIGAQLWSASALGSHPEVIREVHGDYLAAGAHMHIANSFALARHVLEPAGLGDQTEAYNRRAVALCREALEAAPTGRRQWIAASLSTFAEASDRGNLPPHAALLASYREQAGILAAAGADLFALEMLYDVEVSKLMIEAVAPFGLPVMIGFTCLWAPDGETVESMAREVGVTPRPLDELLPTVLSAVPKDLPVIPAIMHSEFDVTGKALEVAAEHWSGPLAAYPNSGIYEMPNWRFDTVAAPEVFAEAAVAWRGQGAKIIGGCCGVGPAQIAALATRI
jgi:homocysteine S-methyltransferase